MKIIKQLFQVTLSMCFFVSMALSGVVINMEMESEKGAVKSLFGF